MQALAPRDIIGYDQSIRREHAMLASIGWSPPLVDPSGTYPVQDGSFHHNYTSGFRRLDTTSPTQPSPSPAPLLFPLLFHPVLICNFVLVTFILIHFTHQLVIGQFFLSDRRARRVCYNILLHPTALPLTYIFSWRSHNWFDAIGQDGDGELSHEELRAPSYF